MAGFNFMQRFYYGKAGQADYTPDQMPSNRVQLFFEMLRIHFTGIILVNLMYLVFCLPAILWSGINVMALLAAQETQSLAEMQGLLLTYLLGMIPCLAIAGVGAPGEMYVLRNWARDQHAFTLSDFKDAVKENWKYGLITGLINGVSLFLVAVCYFFYGQMAAQSAFFLIPQMLAVAVAIVWWMMNMLIYTMMVTYEMKYKDLLRNSALMAIARLPWSALFLFAPVAVPAVIALFVPYGEIAMIVVYLVLGFALTGFIYASYANSCFDKFLNPRIEGAKVNMGLREDGDEEDDAGDEEPDERLV